MFDNSESMDAYMAGTLVTGTDPNTRGNIGRSVLRDSITRYRANFNWGLMSYGLSDGPALYPTYVYYFGDATTMVFTDDCVSGFSPSHANLGCVANPEPFSGGNFVTFAKSSDDPSILDVLYIGLNFTSLWAYGRQRHLLQFVLRSLRRRLVGRQRVLQQHRFALLHPDRRRLHREQPALSAGSSTRVAASATTRTSPAAAR